MTDAARHSGEVDLQISLRSPEVLVRLLAALDARPAGASQEFAAEWMRAQLLRSLGDLHAAAEAYTRCSHASPADPRAAARAALMRGDPNGVLEQGGPVPFLIAQDFLTASDYAELLELVGRHRDLLRPAAILGGNGSEVDLSRRSSITAPASPELRAFLKPRMEVTAAALRLPHRLGIAEFGGELEMQVTSHTDAGFFRAHRDTGPERPTRAITFLLYLKRPTARFTGGDLLLYDDAGEQGFTRIVPQDNMLLFFPADRLHEVSTLACRAEDPLDGRVTVNGWYHRPAAQSAI